MRLSAEERRDIASLGGYARAEAMTEEERVASAARASRAAAAKMTPEERRAKAARASAARWAGHKKKPKPGGGDSASA
jgi:hypothetical protein